MIKMKMNKIDFADCILKYATEPMAKEDLDFLLSGKEGNFEEDDLVFFEVPETWFIEDHGKIRFSMKAGIYDFSVIAALKFCNKDDISLLLKQIKEVK